MRRQILSSVQAWVNRERFQNSIFVFKHTSWLMLFVLEMYCIMFFQLDEENSGNCWPMSAAMGDSWVDGWGANNVWFKRNRTDPILDLYGSSALMLPNSLHTSPQSQSWVPSELKFAKPFPLPGQLLVFLRLLYFWHNFSSCSFSIMFNIACKVSSIAASPFSVCYFSDLRLGSKLYSFFFFFKLYNRQYYFSQSVKSCCIMISHAASHVFSLW